jgi:hypothetical protein
MSIFIDISSAAIDGSVREQPDGVKRMERA